MEFKEFLKGIVYSKKFWVAIAGLVAVLTGIPQNEILPIILLVATYLIGQGLSDMGKGIGTGIGQALAARIK